MNENAPSSHEQITVRARELWQRAGSPSGRDLEFWLAAENELQPSRDSLIPLPAGIGATAVGGSTQPGRRAPVRRRR